MTEVRAVAWDDTSHALVLLDQTALPAASVELRCADVESLVDAIRRLAVRGAPALGIAGAYGVALVLSQAAREDWGEDRVRAAVGRLRDARPTAVNLASGVDRAYAVAAQGLQAVVAEADLLAAEDEAANHRLSAIGADWVLARVARRPVRVLTHCNAGALATSAWGTALGIVRELHARGALASVVADETRPLLQGSRLTAWELAADGIDVVVEVDGAAAGTVHAGMVDVAVVGADRIARNGDVANKVGTLGVALACHDAGVPFVVAAPATTVDTGLGSGAEIPIELRPEEEVLTVSGVRVAPPGVRAHNPAFDVTPHRLIDAIVTEHGVAEPDGTDLAAVLTGRRS